MGKWCEVNLPAGFYERAKQLGSLSKQALDELWVACGSRSIADYGLSWYSGISGDGWACIDDSATTCRFKLFADRGQFLSGNVENWERMACILAHDVGMQIVKHIGDEDGQRS